MNESNESPCTCAPCPATGCTCGCQAVAQQSACTCGPQCGCGDACACAQHEGGSLAA